MNSINPAYHSEGLTLRQAALIAGIGYLMPVAFAEFSIWPKLVIPGNIEQTVQNITAHGGLFVAAILCYLITLIEDVVIAWALYVLLVPVNRSLSLLTAWFRYTPDYLTTFGSGPLHAQVRLLLNSFRYDWNMGLVLFGIHLVLLGYLIYRSGYIPWVVGILLVLDGLGTIIGMLQPYLYPNAHLGFIFSFSFVELLLPAWLLLRGWKIQEPTAYS